MPARLSLSERIETCIEVMTTLGVFPSSFTADGSAAELAAVMHESALVERSTGTYSPERIPLECDRMIWRIEQTWYGRFEQPDLNIDARGTWPELAMELPASRVHVRLVMPEAGVDGSTSPWALGVASDVKLALGWVARVLRTAGEPPVHVDLTYVVNPGADQQRQRLPEEHRALVPPVVGTIGIDRRSCRKRQRRALDEAVRSARYADKVRWIDGGGFSVLLGLARVQATP